MKASRVEVPPAPACREECRLVLHLFDGRLEALETPPGTIPCAACLAALRLVRDGERRVVAPQRPRRSKHAALAGDEFDRCSWDEAYEVLMRGLAAVARGERSLVHVDLSERSSWSQVLVERFAGLAEGATLVRASERAHERWLRELTEPARDAQGLAGCDLVVAWGSDPLAGPFARDASIDAAVRRGAELCSVDVRASRTARAASVVVHPRPGTDTALALGVLASLCRRGRGRESLPSGWISALDVWDDALVERTSGARSDAVERLVARLCDARRPLLVVGRGVLERGTGREALRAICGVARAVDARLALPWVGADVTRRARRPPTAVGVRTVGIEELPAVLAERRPSDDVLMIDGGVPWARPWALGGALAEYARAASLSVLFAAAWSRPIMPADLVIPSPLFHEETSVVGRGGEDVPLRVDVEASAPVDVVSRARVWRRVAREAGLALEWFPLEPEDLVQARRDGGDGRIDAPLYRPVEPSGELPCQEERGDGPSRTPDLARAFGLHLIVVRDLPREVEDTVARLAVLDAEARGLVDGEPVVVHNERGQVAATASVDPEAPSGVLELHLPAEEGPTEAEVEALGPLAEAGRASFVDPCLVEAAKREE